MMLPLRVFSPLMLAAAMIFADIHITLLLLLIRYYFHAYVFIILMLHDMLILYATPLR